MRKQTKGFTLVEVIVVLVILAILAAIMIPAMTGWIDEAKKKSAYVEIHTVAMAAKTAYAECYAVGNYDVNTGLVYSTNDDGIQDAIDRLIQDDAIIGRIEEISISGATLYIQYLKDGTRYNYYADDEGKVTITEFPGAN